MTIRRPPLRYLGGKWRAGSWILKHFPPKYLAYIEPFCGGASLLFQKPRSSLEVINDLSGDVVNFFKVLRERPEELIRYIDLTPWSREELERAFEPTDDPQEKARRFYVTAWQSHAGAPASRTSGWRTENDHERGNTSLMDDWQNTGHLHEVARRLKGVQIEHDDALNVIRRFDGSDNLFYLDPPYVMSTRNRRRRKDGYRHEMDDAAHVQLAEVLHKTQGFVILSGYPSVLYDELYGGWQKKCRRFPTNFQGVGEECIWLNPRLTDSFQQLGF